MSESPKEGRPIIRLTDVNVEWDGRKVLRDVNLAIGQGDFIAITGPNGGGKTTLLRVLLRLVRPTSGTVEYLSGADDGRLSIGYLPQKNMIDSRFPITVSEVIGMGIVQRRGVARADVERRVADMTALVGLEAHAHASLGSLSGGQMQRALLGRALISSPEVLVLDEPLSYLDKRFEHRVYDIVAQLPSDVTVILVSHDMSTIASMANRHIIVDGTLEFCHSGNHFAHYSCCDHPQHRYRPVR